MSGEPDSREPDSREPDNSGIESLFIASFEGQPVQPALEALLGAELLQPGHRGGSGQDPVTPFVLMSPGGPVHPCFSSKRATAPFLRMITASPGPGHSYCDRWVPARQLLAEAVRQGWTLVLNPLTSLEYEIPPGDASDLLGGDPA